VLITTFAELAGRIAAADRHGLVRLVAVDGPGGAGKSTFAGRLAVALDDAPVIPIDDFLSWEDLTGWWPRFEQQVVEPLLAGRPAVYQRRDWEHDYWGAALGPWRTVPPAPVVVVEGVTASRRALAGRLACAVWVDTTPEVRLGRGLRRDGARIRAAWLDFMGREEAFFAADGTRERADVLVDAASTLPHDPEREFVQLRVG